MREILEYVTRAASAEFHFLAANWIMIPFGSQDLFCFRKTNGSPSSLPIVTPSRYSAVWEKMWVKMTHFPNGFPSNSNVAFLLEFKTNLRFFLKPKNTTYNELTKHEFQRKFKETYGVKCASIE
jgi:hypothetical protein